MTGSTAGDPGALVRLVASCVDAGVRIVQYREKTASGRARFETARSLVKVCRARGALLIVNDRLDVALAAGADGVHLGRDDLDWASARRVAPAPFILGCTAPTADWIRRAIAAGADYAGAGPARPSRTKPDTGPVLGVDDYGSLARACADRPGDPLPLVAIGGIAPGHARGLLEAGASAVAVSGAIVASDDPAGTARALLDELASAASTEARP